jgi:hypothetical protein
MAKKVALQDLAESVSSSGPERAEHARLVPSAQPGPTGFVGIYPLVMTNIAMENGP